jgi:hypothetical protein
MLVPLFGDGRLRWRPSLFQRPYLRDFRNAAIVIGMATFTFPLLPLLAGALLRALGLAR